MRARGVQPELLRPAGGREQHRGGAVGDLRRRARGVHAVFAGDRLQRGELLERRLAQAFVARRRGGSCRWACRRRRRSGASIGTTSRSKRPSRHARGGAHLRLEAEVVAVGAGDAPLVGDALGRLELGRRTRTARSTTSGAGGRGRCCTATPSGTRLIDSTPHAIATSTTPAATSAAARLVACCDEPHWASTVVPATLDREAGGEPRGASDVEGLLAGLGDAAADDLADGARGRCPAAIDRGLQHGGEEVGGVDGRQARRCGGRAGSGRLRR